MCRCAPLIQNWDAHKFSTQAARRSFTAKNAKIAKNIAPSQRCTLRQLSNAMPCDDLCDLRVLCVSKAALAATAGNEVFETAGVDILLCVSVLLWFSMMTTQEAIALGERTLPRRRGIPDPHREAMWLLARAWGVDEITLRLHTEREVPAEIEVRYRGWLARRAAGEPAHHLTGECEFWGRSFMVSPAVLVPRPETELVVQVALDLPLSRTAQVLDVGTGSGCIAVSLAAERPKWRVSAIDRSSAALEVARANARRHGVEIGLPRSRSRDLGGPALGSYRRQSALHPD